MVGFKQEPVVSAPEGKQAALTVVARETRLVGELSGSRGVRIEGAVQGKLELKAALEVAEGAAVEAEIHATAVRVAGSVVGNITATELVELMASAQVKGDITTPALRVIEGAKLEGRVQMRVETPAGRNLPPQTGPTRVP